MLKKAFTLIELLVVISIIALLLAILMPGLQKAKELASAIPCLANQRSIAQAFWMYAEDYNGWTVTGHAWFGPDQTSGSESKYDVERSWVCVPMNDNGKLMHPPLEPTVEDEINGIKAGKLWPYLESIDSFHCPGDKRVSKSNIGFRSYSMAAGFGASYGEFVTEDQELHKIQEIRSPASKYITIEEIEKLPEASGGGYWWNMGSWVIDLNDNYWFDAVASWHAWGCNFAFADGHAEKIKWKDDWTKEWLQGEADKQALSMERRDASENPDLLFMLRSFPYKKTSKP